MAKINCPNCNQEYEVDESMVGQKVQCGVCDVHFSVQLEATHDDSSIDSRSFLNDKTNDKTATGNKMCPNCKHHAENDELFCPKCGTKLESLPEQKICKSCGAELKPDAVFCSQCGSKQDKKSALDNPSQLASLNSDSSHKLKIESNIQSSDDCAVTEIKKKSTCQIDIPLRRFAARVLDIEIEGLIPGFIVYLLLAMIFNTSNVFVAEIIYLPLAFLVDDAVYAICGTTLGKWLMGIKIIDQDGNKIKNKKYAIRNLWVYVGGFGLGLAIVKFIMMAIQFLRVLRSEPASYDKEMSLTVVDYDKTPLKTAIGIVLFVPLVSLEILRFVNS